MFSLLHNIIRTTLAAHSLRVFAGLCALMLCFATFLQLHHFAEHNHTFDPVRGTVQHTPHSAGDHRGDHTHEETYNGDVASSADDIAHAVSCAFLTLLHEPPLFTPPPRLRGDPGRLQARALFLERSWHPFAPIPPSIPAHLLAPKTSPPSSGNLVVAASSTLLETPALRASILV